MCVCVCVRMYVCMYVCVIVQVYVGRGILEPSLPAALAWKMAGAADSRPMGGPTTRAGMLGGMGGGCCCCCCGGSGIGGRGEPLAPNGGSTPGGNGGAMYIGGACGGPPIIMGRAGIDPSSGAPICRARATLSARKTVCRAKYSRHVSSLKP
jgi:hypothetical protein